MGIIQKLKTGEEVKEVDVNLSPRGPQGVMGPPGPIGDLFPPPFCPPCSPFPLFLSLPPSLPPSLATILHPLCLLIYAQVQDPQPSRWRRTAAFPICTQTRHERHQSHEPHYLETLRTRRSGRGDGCDWSRGSCGHPWGRRPLWTVRYSVNHHSVFTYV